MADECIQILGGMGYMKVSYVPFNDLERYRVLQKDSRSLELPRALQPTIFFV